VTFSIEPKKGKIKKKIQLALNTFKDQITSFDPMGVSLSGGRLRDSVLKQQRKKVSNNGSQNKHTYLGQK